MARASHTEALAYTCAVDLCGDEAKALNLAKSLLKDVRKSGLKSPFAEALLRRRALEEWTKLDRPRPHRVDSKDPKEAAILLFFRNAWGATYEDLGAALSVSEDRARHLIHKARLGHLASLARIPIPRPECRRPRELLSDFCEGRLAGPLAEDVARHLEGCHECGTLNNQLAAFSSLPPKPLVAPPREIVDAGKARPALSASLDVLSRAKRGAGVAFLAMGVALGVVELHPGLNASASAQMDKMGATLTRWLNRGERLMEDLRVLRALAVGTMEGRTEELSQTLEEYVNSGNLDQTVPSKNKPTPDAVLESRDPKTQPKNLESPGPGEGSRSLEKR